AIKSGSASAFRLVLGRLLLGRLSLAGRRFGALGGQLLAGPLDQVLHLLDLLLVRAQIRRILPQRGQGLVVRVLRLLQQLVDLGGGCATLAFAAFAAFLAALGRWLVLRRRPGFAGEGDVQR